MVLVVTALLFVRTLHNLTTADSGFDIDVTMVVVDYQHAQVPPESSLDLQARVLDASDRCPVCNRPPRFGWFR